MTPEEKTAALKVTEASFEARRTTNALTSALAAERPNEDTVREAVARAVAAIAQFSSALHDYGKLLGLSLTGTFATPKIRASPDMIASLAIHQCMHAKVDSVCKRCLVALLTKLQDGKVALSPPVVLAQADEVKSPAASEIDLDKL